MKFSWKKLTLLVILVVLIFVGYQTLTASTKPKKITAINPQFQNIETTISSGGKIQAINQRSLSFNSSGKLLYMPYAEGDEVKKGQVLGYLDQSEAKEQTNKAWSDYRNTLEKLREFENNNKDKPKNDTYQISKAQLEATRDSYSALVAQSLASQSKSSLISPISGTITAVNNKPGESVTAGSPVIVIANLNELEFVAETDEQDIGMIDSSQSAKLSIDAFPEVEITGKVKEISKTSKLNAAGGTYFPVKVIVDPTQYTLRSGMNGDVEILTAQKTNVLTIPRDIIQEDDSTEFVYIVESGMVQKRDIKTGLKNDIDAEITSGLSPQDRLVSSPLDSIKEGDSVTE
jgi:HlyD family secretion protein